MGEPIVSQTYYTMDGWDIIPLLHGDSADPLTLIIDGLLLFRVDPPPHRAT